MPADDDDDSNKLNFDHESFSCAVQNILGKIKLLNSITKYFSL